MLNLVNTKKSNQYYNLFNIVTYILKLEKNWQSEIFMETGWLKRSLRVTFFLLYVIIISSRLVKPQDKIWRRLKSSAIELTLWSLKRELFDAYATEFVELA